MRLVLVLAACKVQPDDCTAHQVSTCYCISLQGTARGLYNTPCQLFLRLVLVLAAGYSQRTVQHTRSALLEPCSCISCRVQPEDLQHTRSALLETCSCISLQGTARGLYSTPGQLYLRLVSYISCRVQPEDCTAHQVSST